MKDLTVEKIKATQVLYDEIDELAREESKISFVASEIYKKYFAEEISPESIGLLLNGDRRDLRLSYDILLDYLFNVKKLVHALSSASCGNHSRSVARNSAPEERV